jgi:hypothetical protein
MAVGDVVNGIDNGALLIFQPAAGVEVCITSACAWLTSTALFDGTKIAYISQSAGGSTDTNINVKIMINNTNYLRVTGTVNGSSYSGIQIK